VHLAEDLTFRTTVARPGEPRRSYQLDPVDAWQGTAHSLPQPQPGTTCDLTVRPRR
jgi:hypothetical protein